MKMGKFDEASNVLQKADFINPFHVDRLLHLGDAYLHIQKFDRAKGCFEKASDIAPDNEAGKKGVGKAMLLGGDDLNEALALIKQLSGAREMASVFNGAAILSMLHGKFGEGMKLYGIALKTISDDPSVLSKLAFNMGIGFRRKKQIPEASKCFQIALLLDADNNKAKEYLASLPEQEEEDLPDNPDGLVNVLLRMV
jgi:tetratricopeptide (TPR) repeat protein